MIKDRGLYQRNGKWGIRYSFQGREVREIIGPSKTTARAVLAKRKAQIAEGRFFPDRERRRKTTLAAWIERHLAGTKDTHKDHRHRKIYADWWSDRLGARAIDSILPSDVERAIAEVRASRSPATANRYLAFLKRVFTQAQDDGLVDRNPVRPVKLTREPAGRTRWLTDEEEEALAGQRGKTISWEDFDVIRLAINTGLRQGELWRLCWEHVVPGGDAIVVPETKNGCSRYVPLNEAAKAALSVLHGIRVPGETRVVRGDPTATAKRFQRACEAAGLGHVRWHDLRHTFASRLVMRGVPLHTVRELLGHKTIAMTMRYAHLAQGHLSEAVRVLDETVTKPSPSLVSQSEALGRPVAQIRNSAADSLH